jgi:hypothetical protein
MHIHVINTRTWTIKYSCANAGVAAAILGDHGIGDGVDHHHGNNTHHGETDHAHAEVHQYQSVTLSFSHDSTMLTASTAYSTLQSQDLTRHNTDVYAFPEHARPCSNRECNNVQHSDMQSALVRLLTRTQLSKRLRTTVEEHDATMCLVVCCPRADVMVSTW